MQRTLRGETLPGPADEFLEMTPGELDGSAVLDAPPAGETVGVDELLNAVLAPFATALSDAIFFEVSIGGVEFPLIVAWLIVAVGDPLMPAYWIAAAGAISLLTAIFLVHETRFQPLR